MGLSNSGPCIGRHLCYWAISSAWLKFLKPSIKSWPIDSKILIRKVISLGLYYIIKVSKTIWNQKYKFKGRDLVQRCKCKTVSSIPGIKKKKYIYKNLDFYSPGPGDFHSYQVFSALPLVSLLCLLHLKNVHR